MILLVDPGFREGSLGYDEFVCPIAGIVERAGLPWACQHYTALNEDELRDAAGIIICGTALKDNAFLENLERFSWLRNARVPVLGVCAGMQVLCLAFGGSVRPGCEIGMTSIRITVPHQILPDPPSFMAYELHTHSCVPPHGWEILAESEICIQAIRDPERPFFGVLFHPEVRYDRVVKSFLELCEG